jgi:hypothetical protein
MVGFRAGVAVLFCVAWAGTAAAQYRPPDPPPEAPYVAPPPYCSQESFRKWQEEHDQRVAAGAAYLEFLLGVLAVCVLTWAVLRACAYFGLRRDPAKSIMDDPWVRSRLARQGAPPDQPAPGPPA